MNPKNSKDKTTTFSLRIVTADYYLCSPVPDLDVTRSEFRGTEISQVPILRIFGITPVGQKTCLHVHGVFPYLYIPCENINPESKQIYLLANSIDKAINISLKQSNSQNQHVYKIVLVKGVPFYGYHSKDHQFYKIFFYNPFHIKRTADLLQSGGILGVSYQPHEAHLNFVMQFFIDFNLYGMSFINMEYVKFRRKSGNNDSQSFDNNITYLPNTVQYTSRCEFEVDCLAVHILNRQEILSGSFCVNPGLEALWADEQKRHQNLHMSYEIAPTLSQPRENIFTTISHNYFSEKFRIKLVINSEINDNLPTTTNESLSESIDLINSLCKDNLNSSVYPAETPSENDLTNATNITLHHPFSFTNVDSENTEFSKNNSEVFVNEDIVIKCSQNTPIDNIELDNEDFEFMVLLEGMENKVEDDSILSKQSQELENDEHQNEKLKNVFSKSSDQYEKELISGDNFSSQILSWNDSFWDSVKNISQLDGAWDEEDKQWDRKKKSKTRINKSQDKVKTSSEIFHKKEQKTFNLESQFKIFETTPIKLSPKKSPKKSPRNFTPLVKVIEKTASKSQTITNSLVTSPICTSLKRKRHFSSLRNVKRKILSQNQNCHESNSLLFNEENKSNENLLEKPKTGGKNKYNEDNESTQNDSKCSEIKTFSTPREQKSENISGEIFKIRKSQSILNYGTTIKKITSSQYDRQNNYFPQPGTSGAMEKVSHESNDIDYSLPNFDESFSSDRNIISFYDKTCCETSLFLNLSNNCTINPVSELKSSNELKYSFIQENNLQNLKSDQNFKKNNKIHTNSIVSQNPRKLILTTKISPPSLFDILSTMDNFDIPKQKNPTPFYSNYKDIGGQIEIGQIILKLKGRNTSCLKEFETNIPNNENLSKQRQKLFSETDFTQNNTNLHNLESALSSVRSCVLTPVIKPPSKKNVLKWIQTLNSKKNDQNHDSKVREKMHIFMPNSPDQDLDNSQFEVLSVSSCSQTSESDDFIKIDNKHSQHSDESDIMCGQKIENSLAIISSSKDNAKSKNNKFTLCENKCLSTSNAFKFSGDNYQEAEVHHENDYLTLLTLEVHTSTRGDLNPDPQFDPLCALFYSILNNCPEHHKFPTNETGFIVIEDNMNNGNQKNIFKYVEGLSQKYNIITVQNEEGLFDEILNIIYKWDPDILCGYEIEMLSWGYLIHRAFVLNINLPDKMSRIMDESKTGYKKYTSQDSREIKLIGRITLDVWRLLRHEIALTNYTFENITYHVLHERIPLFSFKTLSFWWHHPSKLLKSLCVEYFLTRVIGTIRILQQLDLIGRTSELAKLFGIQWYEVLSRGSQFRVESMMFRMSRSHNFVLVSPSIQQRAAMKAPECLPLILEPESRFYSDPVIVLDFQSLYPSMMIAYNYCFSTCIGKIDNIGRNDTYEFGASCLRISMNALKKLNDKNLINWSPCGVGFVKSTVRKGILPSMLQSILNTRFMVKKAMKKYKSNKTLLKILHNRQLGLKLIANVTYGYTAANFSGRMPCVEVGDSVVAKGRETLERAIKTVKNSTKWNAKVVYGDTDSIFVLLPGRSRFEAFEIGAEIADMVTNENPSPVKLKLEKVYQPCILQTKKRYVGYKYESIDQKLPEYEAKGIETVRRDGCPASVKILEKSLKILFETCDVSKVKSYLFKKFQNIIEDKCNTQDFIFAREFRGIHAYKPGASVPALEIVKRLKLTDPRKEPRQGERVPYVIINGAPGETLLHCARRPQDLLLDPSLRINHFYYITRVIIPPLNRCLTLIGADVNLWLVEMPRKQVQLYPLLDASGKLQENKKSTISQYFTKVNCVGCDEQTTDGLCIDCGNKPQTTLLKLNNKINNLQRKHILLKKICQSCCGRGTQINCVSIDCPNIFHLNTAELEVQQIPYLLQTRKNLLNF